MRNMSLLFVSTLSLLTSYSLQAQHVPISRLEVKIGTTYTVGPDNILLVDTLIMQDRSVIKFASSTHGKLVAKVAFIGNYCTITAKGEDGIKGLDGESMGGRTTGKRAASTNRDGGHGAPGTNGEAGGNLDINIHFAELIMLLIDTRGGNGGDGGNGGKGYYGNSAEYIPRTVVGSFGNQTTEMVIQRNAVSPGNGGHAAPGGLGGAGGDVLLTYSSDGKPPQQNHSADVNKIIVLHAAGQQGIDGIPGKGGTGAASGTAVRTHLQPAPDGVLQVINKNKL